MTTRAARRRRSTRHRPKAGTPEAADLIRSINASLPKGVVLARYDGRCPACHRPVIPGDPIKWDGTTHGYGHERCVER